MSVRNMTYEEAAIIALYAREAMAQAGHPVLDRYDQIVLATTMDYLRCGRSRQWLPLDGSREIDLYPAQLISSICHTARGLIKELETDAAETTEARIEHLCELIAPRLLIL